MSDKDRTETSNAKEKVKSDAKRQRTMGDRTGESAHEMQIQAHSKNTSAMQTVYLYVFLAFPRYY